MVVIVTGCVAMLAVAWPVEELEPVNVVVTVVVDREKLEVVVVVVTSVARSK